MIEWFITPIKTFNRKKRRLDPKCKEMENTEVTPRGPVCDLEGSVVQQSCKTITVCTAVMNHLQSV